MSDEHQNGELKALLEQNIKYSKEILVSTETIKRFIIVRQVWGFVKFVIIIAMIIFGFITVKPFINQATSTYKDLLDAGASLKTGSEGLQNLVNTYQR